MTVSGDTQAFPRISVPGVDGVLPTVALTLASTHDPGPAVAPAATPAGAPAESHEQIYEEAMATIAALASIWTSPVKPTGRHRAAA